MCARGTSMDLSSKKSVTCILEGRGGRIWLTFALSRSLMRYHLRGPNYVSGT